MTVQHLCVEYFANTFRLCIEFYASSVAVVFCFMAILGWGMVIVISVLGAAAVVTALIYVILLVYRYSEALTL